MELELDLEAGGRWSPALRALGDERLARMVEHGSDPAFATIYNRYSAVLHGYCRSIVRDDEETGDALQNTMLKALQAMRRSARSGPLRPWLFRIAHNESINIIRARGRRPVPLDDAIPAVAGGDDAFRHAASREQLASLLEDIQQLTDHQRGALVMRELGGLTYDEIGQALETTPLAARQAVFIARKHLREGVPRARRLRPALRQLIPAPGFALFGFLASGGKALIGTAAVVSVGVGSVELAKDLPAPGPRREAVAQVAPATTGRRPKAVVTPAATAASTPAAAAGRTTEGSPAQTTGGGRSATVSDAEAGDVTRAPSRLGRADDLQDTSAADRADPVPPTAAPSEPEGGRAPGDAEPRVDDADSPDGAPSSTQNETIPQQPDDSSSRGTEPPPADTAAGAPSAHPLPTATPWAAGLS